MPPVRGSSSPLVLCIISSECPSIAHYHFTPCNTTTTSAWPTKSLVATHCAVKMRRADNAPAGHSHFPAHNAQCIVLLYPIPSIHPSRSLILSRDQTVVHWKIQWAGGRICINCLNDGTSLCTFGCSLSADEGPPFWLLVTSYLSTPTQALECTGQILNPFFRRLKILCVPVCRIIMANLIVEF